MIRLSLCLLVLGASDLIQSSAEGFSLRRTIVAGTAGIALAIALQLLSGASGLETALTTLALAAIDVAWLGFCHATWSTERPRLQLGFVLAVLILAGALSGSGGRVAGAVREWYRDLPIDHLGASPDRFVLGASALVFALASSNRIVRLTLRAAGTSFRQAEASLKGGRILGAMERVFIGVMVVAGNITAAAALIAAKGLLRLPEIRDTAAQRGGASDEVTEYFLIGTFTSLLIAASLGLVVSVSR